MFGYAKPKFTMTENNSVNKSVGSAATAIFFNRVNLVTVDKTILVVLF